MKEKIKAVLFDLDGVLVKSMPYHLRAWEWAFQKNGIPVTQQTLALHEGLRSADMARKIAKEAGIILDNDKIEQIVLEKRNYYQEIAKIEFYPKALELIDAIQKISLQLGIVTSCVRNSLNRAIPVSVQPFFEYIVTGDEIKNGKPKPDPFLLAADHLQRSSSECLVIENAPLGIQAAKAAGMPCVAITTTLEKEYLAGADFIIDDLTAVLPIIQRLNNRE
ncbi:HAD family phosphatase [candidate division KSB1 bacterium]|nr:HAD family phosphatase [candidate division KSB1 bacterium]